MPAPTAQVQQQHQQRHPSPSPDLRLPALAPCPISSSAFQRHSVPLPLPSNMCEKQAAPIMDWGPSEKQPRPFSGGPRPSLAPLPTQHIRMMRKKAESSPGDVPLAGLSPVVLGPLTSPRLSSLVSAAPLPERHSDQQRADVLQSFEQEMTRAMTQPPCQVGGTGLRFGRLMADSPCHADT